MLFDKDIKLYGKHAVWLKGFSDKTDEVVKDKEIKGPRIFKLYIDTYMAAAVIGAVKRKKADVDRSVDEAASIFGEAVVKYQDKLKFIYRLVLLTDNSGMSEEEKIENAFRYDNDPERTAKNMEIFNSYVRGGIEWLHEKFEEGVLTEEDTIERVFDVVQEYQNDYEE